MMHSRSAFRAPAAATLIALAVATPSSGGQVESALTSERINAAVVKRLVTGFRFTEGPVWDSASGSLLFSDLDLRSRAGNIEPPVGAIHRLTPPSTVTVVRKPSGNTNGLALDATGRLLAAEHGRRRISRETNGTIETLADQFDGKPLNAPNDLVVDRRGAIYFTDPSFVNRTPDLPFNGVFRINPDRTLDLISRDVAGPNGIALSRDERTLYVADQPNARIVRLALRADGTAESPQVFVTDTPRADGMTIGPHDEVVVATGDGILIFARDGARLGAIPVPERPTNCTFGGDRGRVLFITAQTSIYVVDFGP